MPVARGLGLQGPQRPREFIRGACIAYQGPTLFDLVAQPFRTTQTCRLKTLVPLEEHSADFKCEKNLSQALALHDRRAWSPIEAETEV